MRDRIAHVLSDLTDKQVEDVYLYALSRAIGPAAMQELASREPDHMMAKSCRRLLDWGLIDHFSYRKTELGRKLARKAKEFTE